MGTIVDKFEYLKQTKSDIRNSIISMGVEVPDTLPFRNYSDKIKQISNEWKPQPDWWDIDKILEEDIENYLGKMICLLSDSYITSTINRLNADKVVTSDGVSYTDTSQTFFNHTWDVSKDKECSLGYKTRYVIWYFSKSEVYLNDKIPKETVYVLLKNLNYKTNFQVDARAAFNLNSLLAIKFINCICNDNNIGYKFASTRVRHLEGFVTKNLSGPLDLANNHNIKIYGVDKAQEIFNEIYNKTQSKVLGSQGIWNLMCYYVPYFDCSNITNFNVTFCSMYVQSIEEINFNSATAFKDTFLNDYSLISINTVSNIKISGINLSTSPLLNHDTLLRFLNALYDYSTDTENTYTLTLGTTNLAKLTDEEKAIATNKGWTLA